MKGIKFKDRSTLLAAMLSRNVPIDVQSQPAEVIENEQSVWVKFNRDLPGLKLQDLPQKRLRKICCWAEMIPLEEDKSPDLKHVIFDVKSEADCLALAGELLRLGCVQQSYAAIERLYGFQLIHFMIKAIAPPYYTVEGFHGQADGVAYVQQGTVWVELGLKHPCASGIQTSGLALVGRLGWCVMPSPVWQDIDKILRVTAPVDRGYAPVEIESTLDVPLRLVASEERPVTLWTVKDGLREVERLAASLPQETLNKLLFAVADDTFVLKAREKGVVLAGIGEEYSQHPAIRNLFLPAKTRLEPPVQPAKARELLASDHSRLVWLRREGSSFVPESIPDSALRPLVDLVSYTINLGEEKLRAWVKSSLFDFEGLEVVPNTKVVHEKGVAPQQQQTKQSVVEKPSVQEPRAPQASEAPEEPRLTASTTRPPASPTELSRLEQEYLSIPDEVGLENQTRTRIWEQIAEVCHRLGRHTDAQAAWARAVWAGSEIEALEGLPATEIVRNPQASHAEWLLVHEDALDSRSLWLAREALDDPLALARARDTILARLRGGLQPGREVPGFLVRGQVDAAPLAGLADRVAARPRLAVEAATTGQYCSLTLAWGLARLGHVDAAHARLAGVRLPVDAIHSWLLNAYSARIERASDRGPLSPDLMERLNAMSKFDRYKVDRLRQASEILEPADALDPMQAFQRNLTDSRGEEFARLRSVEDPVELASALRALPAERLEGCLDLCTRLSESDAEPHIVRAYTSQAPILVAKGLIAAASFSQFDRVGRFATSLSSAWSSAQDSEINRTLPRLAGVVQAMRRAGLSERLPSLLRDLAGRAGLVGQIYLGAAEAREGRVTSFWEPAFAALRGDLQIPLRLQICRAFARSLAALPSEQALERLLQLEQLQLASITDSFATNSHFCLSVVHFVESLVWGHTGDDMMVDAQLRRMLDEDEFLIRRRLVA